MKQLLIMRHAKSDWQDSHLSDHQRPLNGRGLTDAPRMGQWLKAHNAVPNLIISSTANRAHTTAQLLIEAAGFAGTLLTTDDFYLASPNTYIRHLQQITQPQPRVMVIGHNSGLEELVTVLTGEMVYLTTANIAVVDLPIEQWAALTVQNGPIGQLQQLWRPHEI